MNAWVQPSKVEAYLDTAVGAVSADVTGRHPVEEPVVAHAVVLVRLVVPGVFVPANQAFAMHRGGVVGGWLG